MNRKLRDILVLVALSLGLIWSLPALGQVLKGSISGTVTDPQGAVVSGAQVKATSVQTGAVLTTTSDSSGLFRFSLIPVGNYKVEVTAPGFKTAVHNDVVVSSGVDSGLGQTKLAVGETTTTVEVAADAPLIETTESQVTNTFAGTQLTTFAGVNENEGLDNLALFVPGVVASRDIGFSNVNGGSGFSVNGLRGRNNDQEIDGQNNNDNSIGGPGLFVSDTEFVQQYVLVTNQFGPEYGRNAGSVVNIVTKSGTNSWHGSLYGNENNTVMNSMTNFQKRFNTDANGNPLTEIPRANDEFAGGTIGGPWIKNKVFFFGGFDQEIVSQNTLYESGGLVPTPAGIATLQTCSPGSQSLAALSTFGPFAISAGNPTAVNRQLVDETGCPGVELANVERLLPTHSHAFNFILKNDFQIGSDAITARYLFNRANFFNQDGGDASTGFPINIPALSQAVLLSWTHNLSSHMVNEARGSFGRLNVQFGTNTLGTVPGIDNVGNAISRATFLDPTLQPFGLNGGFPQGRIVNTYQAQDNWNYILGRHTLKAGVNYTYQRSPNTFLPNLNGAFRFTDWGDFAANTPNRVRVAAGDPTLDFREHDTFVYAGDDLKLGQNLTLNLGLTWSYYGQPANLFNDLTVARENNPATAFWRQDIPLAARTSPALPAPKNSFGPAVGFAYSPHWGGFLTGDGKTVIRGGYRLLYDPPYYNIYLNNANSSPVVFLQSFTGSLITPNMILPSTPTGSIVRGELTSQIQKGVFDPRTFAETSVSPNFGPDKVNSWSLGIERELTKNAALEVRYSGNHAYDLFQSIDGNPAIAGRPDIPAGLTPCTAPTVVLGPGQGTRNPATGRINCDQGVVLERNNGGFSNYHALQTEFRANNLFKQLTIRTAYTFSKTLDNVSEIFSSGTAGNTSAFAQNPLNNGRGEYSFSGLDFPHQWTILLTEQLPFFREQHGFAGHVLGGWSIAGNYILASGQRYTPLQVFGEAISGASANFYDTGFINSFVGTDIARPFVGNLSAPASSVGIFAGDACSNFGACTTAATNPNALLSLNAINATPSAVASATGPNEVVVSQKDVRYIINGGTAQTIFGTPFGAPRNLSTDAMTNAANFSLFKKFRMTERTSFEFHATMLNVFNHANFQSIDPVIEDAGVSPAPGVGFGDPSVTNDTGSNALGNRRIIVGATIRF